MSGRSPLRGSGLRPDGLSQSPLSQAKPLVPNAKWKRGRVKLAFPDAYGSRYWLATDGYTDGTFVLDRRAYSKSFLQEAWGYVISHAASGYAICGVKGPLSKAKALVEQIRHLDWNFAEPEAMPPQTRSAATPILKAAGGGHVTEFLKADWEPIALAGEAATAVETPKSGSIHEHATAQPERPNPTPILPKKERTHE